MIHRLFLSLLLLSISLASRAETLADPAAAAKATQSFMDQAHAGKVGDAYGLLTPYLGVESEPYKKTASEADGFFQKVFNQVGKPLSSAIVRQETIDGHFYRITWLQKYATAAFVWQFSFYQPDSGWRLVGVTYSTDVDFLYKALP